MSVGRVWSGAKPKEKRPSAVTRKGRPSNATSEPGGAVPTARLPCVIAPVTENRTDFSCATTGETARDRDAPRKERRRIRRLSRNKAFFLRPRRGDGRAGIGFLQVHAPIAQGVQGDMRARHGANDIAARHNDFIFAVE